MIDSAAEADGSAVGGSEIEEALAKLEAAMKPTGETIDPDRRRAAARLSALLRSDDEALSGFSRRHLPGRRVDDDAVRELRDLAMGVARLVAIAGGGPGVESMVANLRRALLPNLERLEKEAADHVPGAYVVAQMPEEALPTSPENADGNGEIAPPAIVPLQIVPDAQANFPKPSFAQIPTNHLREAAPAPAPAPAPAVQQPRTAEIPAAAMRSVGVSVPAWVAEPTIGSASSPPPPAPTFGASSPTSVAPAPPARGSLGETMFSSESSSIAAAPPIQPALAATMTPHQDTALPFASGRFAPPSIASVAGPTSTRAPRRDFGQTLDPDAAPISRSLPFQASLPPHLTHIGVEAYAVFFALTLVFPDRQVEVFAQYGLRDRTDKELLDRHWLAKLSDDRALSAQWVKLRDQAVAHYRGSR